MALVRTGLRLRRYLQEARVYEQRNHQAIGLGSLLQYYPRWLAGMRDGVTPLGEKLPWITYPAIRFLRRFLGKGMSAFEYGAGGSTLFIAGRVSHLVTVEHQREWLDKVGAAMGAEGLSNWSPLLVESEPCAEAGEMDFSDPSAYISADPSSAGRSYAAYAAAIDPFPEGHFDLVLIDGRARPSCLVHGAGKVKLGGCLMLDNTDREHYRRAMESVPWKHRFMDFPGPAPSIPFFSRTSAWLRLS